MINPGSLNLIKDGYIDQIGVVVKDVEEASSSFQRLFGIGPFTIFNWPDDVGKIESEYYGKPGNWKMRLAFAALGQMKLELIQPISGESIFMDFLNKRGPGLHHLRYIVEDFENSIKDVKKAGFEIISQGQGVHEGSQWAFIGTQEHLEGVLMEIRIKLDD